MSNAKKGGKRKGAGRKAGLPTFTRSIRTTAEGWKWLETQAGPLSIGMWARKQAGASEQAGTSKPS